MSAVAASKRLLQSVPFTKFGGFNVPTADRLLIDPSIVKFSSYSPTSASRISRHDCRQISQLVKSNGNRAFLVDTLALVRSLEAQGIPTKQAEAITAAINDNLESVTRSFVSKGELQKVEVIQESNSSKIKSELQISQGHQFSSLQHENEKLRGDIEKINEKLRGDIEKIRSELRYEIDKVTAGLRLDLNLEKGHIRDELANQSAETSNLNNKLDQAIHGFRAQLEAAKNELIKYCIGSLVSISAVGLAVVRIFL